MSVTLIQLWMPILLGSLLAWIASIVNHMVLPHHKSDYKQLTNEEHIILSIGKESPSPGIYTFPFCVDMKDMGSESTIAKFNQGPVGMLTVFQNGMPKMGKLVFQQIAYFVVGCFLVAYCAALALPAGSDYLIVFRTVSSIAFLAFGWAVIPFSIWYGHPWSTSLKYLFDALVYALIVAGVFSWLWPSLA